MALKELYYTDCFELQPEKATASDLLRVFRAGERLKQGPPLLGSAAAGAKAETNRSDDFRRGWLVFVSLLLQRILLLCAKPLAKVGSAIELWLNLLSANGGLVSLLVKFLQGKVVKPDRSSAAFRSFIGYLDGRIELDKSITNDDVRYKPALAIMASKLSYENKAFVETVVTDHWKMKFLAFHEFLSYNQYSTTAFTINDTTSDPNLIVVAFRGTEPFCADDWRTDIDISWCEIAGAGKIHSGFMKALGFRSPIIDQWPNTMEKSPSSAFHTIKEKLLQILKEREGFKFMVTGHSLGGALAILFGAMLVLHGEESLLKRLEGIYTFGQPRVGDEMFGKFMKKKLKEYEVKYYRFVYCNDMVPRLPYDDKTLLFKHFGSCLFFNNIYSGQELDEEPNKNYFSILWVIPKIITAFWELVRSFIIPCIRGPDYREGGVMRLFRLIGLVLPGVPAHCPQDYVNLTRLGSLELFGRLKGN